jgi:hypothetical protein
VSHDDIVFSLHLANMELLTDRVRFLPG